MASGEILAFIDDDAVPEPPLAARAGRGVRTRGAGLRGRRRRDRPRQRHARPDHAEPQRDPARAGRHARLRPPGAGRRRTTPRAPGSIASTAATWRSAAPRIEAVGGFDETFIYQHEETDLCVRLIRAGYRIVHHPRALVDHFPATSHFRRDAYDVSYFNILRSYTYFALKHARRARSPTVALRVVPRSPGATGSDSPSGPWGCSITPWRAAKFVRQWLDGYASGLRLGRDWHAGGDRPRRRCCRLRRAEFRAARARPRRGRCPSTRAIAASRIALLCAELGGPSPGGVAVYTEYLAEGLARRGHEVVVFRPGYGPGEAEPDGYRVVGVPPEADRPHSISVLRATPAMGETNPFDVVEAPLWGGEGAAVGAVAASPPWSSGWRRPWKWSARSPDLPLDRRDDRRRSPPSDSA